MEGFISGLHKSLYRGASVEFSEHRKYAAGDDTRHLDWKVFARTDRLYVKVFREETNLKSHILLDASRSMSYGSGEITKLRYATCLAASLAYLMISQKDAAGLVVFDKSVRTFIKPASTTAHLHQYMDALEGVTPGTTTALGDVLGDIAAGVRRRGLIILISDLFDTPSAVMRGLANFRHRHHDVIVFHVLDPAERTFPFSGSHTFVDMESGGTLDADAFASAGDYRAFAVSSPSSAGAPTPISYSRRYRHPFDQFLYRYLGQRSYNKQFVFRCV